MKLKVSTAFVLFLPIFCAAFNSLDEEQQFLKNLLNKTTRNSVPEPNITVQFNLNLFQLLELDEKQNMAIMRMFLAINYDLRKLQWDVNSVKGVKEILLPPETVWTPDLVFLDVSGIIYDGYKDQAISAGIVFLKNNLEN